jgi:hypothetical protein
MNNSLAGRLVSLWMLLLGFQSLAATPVETIDVNTCATAGPYSALYRTCDFYFFYLGGFTRSNIQPPGDVCDPGTYTIARREHTYVQNWSDACVAVEQKCYKLADVHIPPDVGIPPIATHVAVNCFEDYRVAVRGDEEPSYVAPEVSSSSSFTRLLWGAAAAVAAGAMFWVRRRCHRKSPTGIHYRVAARAEEESAEVNDLAMVEMSSPTAAEVADEP